MRGTIKNEQLKKALLLSAAADFGGITEGAAVHEFSAGFESRCAGLIRKERNPFWRCVNTRAKRLALAMAFLLAVCFSIGSVTEAREAVLEWFAEIRQGFNHYLFRNIAKTSIFEELGLTEVPQGFELVQSESSDMKRYYLYKNSSGDKLEFFQRTADRSYIAHDTEYSDYKECRVDGMRVDLYTYKSRLFAVWTQDGYICELFSYGYFTEEQLLELVSDVGPIGD